MVAKASANLQSFHNLHDSMNRQHQLRPRICQIRGGSFIDPAQVVRIHGFVGLAEAAILYGESFGLSPPYLGMEEYVRIHIIENILHHYLIFL